MGHVSQPSNDDTEVVTLWSSLRGGFPRLLMFTALVGALTYGVLSLMAPRYTSQVQISFASQATGAASEDKKGGAGGKGVAARFDRDAIDTHVRALKAPALLLRVADKLKLVERAEFNAARGSVDMIAAGMRMAGFHGPRPGETDEDRVLAAIKSKLAVAAARQSSAIDVRFSSADRRLAAAFANTLAEFYRQSLADVPAMETTDADKTLLPKVRQLETEVLEAEAAVDRYRAEIDQVRSGSEATPVATQRIAALNAELTKAEADASAAEAKWITARDLIRDGGGEVLPEVQRSPAIQGLIAQRVRLQWQVFEAQASLLPAHPRMKQLNSDLAGLKKTIALQVRQIVSSLEKTYRAKALKVAGIKRQLVQLKPTVVNTSGHEARLKALEIEAKSKRDELKRLQKQVEVSRTLAAKRAVPVAAQIVFPARVSGVPTFPKKVPYTLLAMAAAFTLGLALMVARGVVLAGRPVANVLPEAYPANAGADSAMAAAADRGMRAAPSPDVEAAETVPSRTGARPHEEIRSSLESIARHMNENRPPETGYRSIVAGERETIDPADEAVFLARELSRIGGQVILIEWCLNGQGCADEFDLATQPGLMELLAGTAKFEDVIVRLPDSPVHFIPCGHAPDEVGPVLEPDGLNLVLDALDEAYDHIVVVGRYGAAQALFEAIQGRFDAGITIGDGRHDHATAADGGDTFLGFEVAEIDVIHYERPAQGAASSRRSQVAMREVEAV